LRHTGAVAVLIALPHCKPESKQSDRKLVRDRCVRFVAGCKAREITGLDNERERAMFQNPR
jgi:hypothetical protein